MRPVFSLLLALILNQLPVLAGTKQAKPIGVVDPESQLSGIYLEQPSSTSEINEELGDQIKGEKTYLDSASEESAKSAKTSQPSLKLQSEAAVNKSGQSKLVLKGQVSRTIPGGTPLKLKLATVPSHKISLLNRDMDGNLYPAKVGEEITAKTSEDLYIDDNKVIPEGTVFHGQVSKILPARRVGRPGSLVLSFDSLTTPDGRKFAFKADANNFKPSTLRTKAKGFGIICANAAGGAIVGALVAYEVFGLQYTMSMHGYNIAAAAGGGALLATGFAIMRHGPAASLEPGDDLNMRIDSDLLMPVAVEPKNKKRMETIAGLAITLSNGKLVKDGLEGNIYTVDAAITNATDRTFRSIDLYLQDTNGNLCPLVTIPEDESESLFSVEPNSTEHRKLSFTVSFPKLKRQLVWLEHNSRQVCYRLPMP